MIYSESKSSSEIDEWYLIDDINSKDIFSQREFHNELEWFEDSLEIESNQSKLSSIEILFFTHSRFQISSYSIAQFIDNNNDDDDENLHSLTMNSIDVCLFSEKNSYLQDFIDYHIFKLKIVSVDAKKSRITFRMSQFKSEIKSKVSLRLSQSKQAQDRKRFSRKSNDKYRKRQRT